MNYYSSKIFKGQKNREKVARKTIQSLSDVTETGKITEAVNTIDEDWLTQFWNLAETKTNEDVQEILAQILIKEIIKDPQSQNRQ